MIPNGAPRRVREPEGRRNLWLGLVIALGTTTAVVGCGLNPRPEDPGYGSASSSDAGKSSNGAGGTTGLPEATGGAAAVTPSSGGAADGADAAADSSTQTPRDAGPCGEARDAGEDGQASDAGDTGDAGNAIAPDAASCSRDR